MSAGTGVLSCISSSGAYLSDCNQAMVAGTCYPGHYPEHGSSYEMGNYDYSQDSNMQNYEATVPISSAGVENATPPYCSGAMHHEGVNGYHQGIEHVYGGGYTPHQQPFLSLDAYQNSYMEPPCINSHSRNGIVLGPNGKPKRKRVATVAQRRAANIRERRRMFNLNEAFDELRTRVPTFAYEKRLSRIETLRLAITYISFMADVVEGKDPKEVKLVSLKGPHWIPLKKAADVSEKEPPSPFESTRST